jgi:hypothetical protein
MSYTKADRYAVCERATSAVSPSIARRERLLGDREPVLGLHHHQPVSLAEQVDRALQHVEVRGEVHLVGDDGSPIGPGPQRRHRELEQVHRRGVRHHDVGRGGADQRGELRARSAGWR